MKRTTEKEEWLVFTLNNKELCSYTLRGTFPGEKEATIESLAEENNVNKEDIKTYIDIR